MGSPAPDPGGRAAGRLTAIFTKRPVAGRVKTRLCPPLEPAGAARLADGMLRDAVERCVACRGFRTALVFAPAEDAPWFRESFPEPADQRPQRGADLARRLAGFFDSALSAAEVRSAVVIGSDQPWVSSRRIVEAHEELERGADLVLGPDLGGGYYLVGMRRPLPRIFTTVAMSSGAVFAETVRAARGEGLSLAVLAPGYDVDVEADLRRLRGDLDRAGGAGRDFPRHTARRMAELFPVGT